MRLHRELQEYQVSMSQREFLLLKMLIGNANIHATFDSAKINMNWGGVSFNEFHAFTFKTWEDLGGVIKEPALPSAELRSVHVEYAQQ